MVGALRRPGDSFAIKATENAPLWRCANTPKLYSAPMSKPELKENTWASNINGVPAV
jgi:hypothetical protein